MDPNEEVKITTGEGAGPAAPTYAPTPSIPTPPAMPSSGGPDFITAENLGPSPVPPEITGGGAGPLKKIILILVALIFVGGVGALGYFVVYPLLFPVKSLPTPTGVGTPTGSVGAVATPASHISYLAKPAAAVSEVKLSDFKYLTVAAALQNESFSQLADGQFKEVRISDSKGQAPFAKYLEGLSPGLAALGTGTLLEDDFTALLYYDPAGVWPVYIAKLRSGAAPDAVKSGFKQAEGVMDLGNFYVSTPGTFKGFKDGKLGAYATRYNVGSQLGASFNYGIFNNYFMISTSFNALKAALPLLGL